MHTFFEGTRPGVQVGARSAQFELPALYFRDDSFGALFSADLRALRSVMPSDKLHPISLGRRGRGLLYVVAYDYLETSVGPYGEVAVVVPAVYGRRPPPPVLPSVLEAGWPGFGGVVLHLPVTDRAARDGGREVWGYTKFISSMSFQSTPELQECQLSEGNQHILTLHIVKRGLMLRDRRPLITYSVKDGALIKTKIPQLAIARTAMGAGGSYLALGDSHPVAKSIQALDVDLRPVMTRSYVERYAILPKGEIIERDVRALDGYFGAEIPRGELSSTHLPLTVH